MNSETLPGGERGEVSPPSPSRFDFSPFAEQALAFLGRFHRPPEAFEAGALEGAFASRLGGAPDLYGAADAAYALWILDELDVRSTPASRAAWAARIQAFQDLRTGWFDRALLPGHGAPHATAFATGALVLLDASPAHPLAYAERLFASRASIDAWLDGFRWSQIWTGSHAAGAAAAVYDAPAGLALPADWRDTLLAALDARNDPTTGFWKRAWHDRVWRRPTPIDLGGAAHFWWLYDRGGRAIPRPKQALAGLLALQRDTGLWGSRLFGGAFPHGLDFDALHGIRVAWSALDERARAAHRPRILAALDAYARRAHAQLTPPGAVARLFRSPHKLVGTLNALAELPLLAQELGAGPHIETPRPWRSALTRVSWQ